MADWIRVREDEHYDAYARMRNAMFPDQPTTGPLMRASEERTPPAAQMERYLLRHNGEVLGAGIAMHAYWFQAPELFVADALVRPGSAETFAEIHGRVCARASEMGAGRLRTMVSTVVPECIEVLRADGFAEVERFPVTSVDLAAFDPGNFADACRAARESGIEIMPLSEYIAAHPDEWRTRIWRFDMEVSRDMPFQEAWAEIPFEAYRGQFMDVPTFDPELHFVALDGSELVGITMLILVLGDPTLLGTGLTGVSRSHRRRGIATALKVRSLETAVARGYHRVVTENEETNPMLDLNFRLGYRRVYDEVVLARAGGPGSESAPNAP